MASDKMKNKILKIILLLSILLIVTIGVVVFVHVANDSGISPGAQVYSISFSPNDKYIAVTSLRKGPSTLLHKFNGGVQIYDVAKETLYKQVIDFNKPYNPLAMVGAYYSNDGEQLIVHNEKGDICAYGLPKYLYEKAQIHPYVSPTELNWGNGCYAKIDYDDKGNSIVKVRINNHSFVVSPPIFALRMAIGDSHAKLAIAGTSGEIYIYDLSKREFKSHFSCALKPNLSSNSWPVVSDLMWLPKSKILWVSNSKGRSVFWDSQESSVKYDMSSEMIITCAAIDHSGKNIAIGTRNGKVHILPLKQVKDMVANKITLDLLLRKSD